MNIENMTSKELKEIAKELKVKSWWNLKKAELIAAIEAEQKLVEECLEDLRNDMEEAQDASEVVQNEPELIEEPESDNLSDETESPSEPILGPSNLKQYAAWVKDRETKELTKVFGEALSREGFYNSIKGKYRVRLITKPEKIDEECEQWEIRHARNKKIKNDKYAADKAKAMEMNMTVAEYRKMVKANK